MYTDHILSWIPYIILGGWVPGKWYGLTLFHTGICVFISIGVIDFFDKKIEIGGRTRKILLLVIAALFLETAVYNFFFSSNLGDVDDFRQIALLQISLIIGILIKAFGDDHKLD
jgi:hypothetical protein